MFWVIANVPGHRAVGRRRSERPSPLPALKLSWPDLGYPRPAMRTIGSASPTLEPGVGKGNCLGTEELCLEMRLYSRRSSASLWFKAVWI